MEKNPVKLSKIELEKEEDKIFIEVILNNSNYPVKHIIERYRKSIYNMIQHKNFFELNKEEIFYEGLSRVIIKIKKNKFRKDSSVVTFLNRTCYFICLDEIFKIGKRTIRLEEDIEIEEEPYNFPKLDLLLRFRKKIKKKCFEIIHIRFNTELHFDDIALQLNIKSADNAKHDFNRCFKKLKKLIALDSELIKYYKDHGYRQTK